MGKPPPAKLTSNSLNRSLSVTELPFALSVKSLLKWRITSTNPPGVLKDPVDVLARYPGQARHLPNRQDAVATMQRFHDLGHGELGSLVGLHASHARFEQYGAVSVLVAQRWCESPSIAARLILMIPGGHGFPVIAVWRRPVIADQLTHVSMLLKVSSRHSSMPRFG